MQRAGIAALADERHVEAVRDVYRRKRETLLPVLEAKGLRLAGGDATFFLWLAVEGPPSPSRAGCSSSGHPRRAGLVLRPGRRGLCEDGARADPGGMRARRRDPRGRAVTTEETIAALDRGEVRVAEPDGDEWVVNEDVQAAILDYFRTRPMEPREVGPFEYHDKIPLKSGYEELGVRVVPPAVARYGSFLSRGVILMPSYVNIGAWVGPDTMVDTWATVGSGAQIGAGVHLAGGVGIGGVLEPPGARPVIVEDGAFIGSRSIVTEGVHDRPRGGARAERLADGVGADHRRHRRRAGRAPRLRPAARGRRPGHAAEGVSRRHLPPRLRADHRLPHRSRPTSRRRSTTRCASSASAPSPASRTRREGARRAPRSPSTAAAARRVAAA